MTRPNKSTSRGRLVSKVLRVALALAAMVLLCGVLLHLMSDDDGGMADPGMADEAAPGQAKSVYDTLDVLGNYLWGDVTKSEKSDSALRANRDKAEKARAERAKERKELTPSPATGKDVAAVEEMGAQPSQTVPTPTSPPQPSTAAPKIDKVAAPRVEAIGNE